MSEDDGRGRARCGGGASLGRYSANFLLASSTVESAGRPTKQPEAVAALKAAQKAAKAAEGKAARAAVTAQTNATLATEAHARAKEAMQLSNAKKRELEELEAMTPETAAAKKQRGKIRRARGRRRSLK